MVGIESDLIVRTNFLEFLRQQKNSRNVRQKNLTAIYSNKQIVLTIVSRRNPMKIWEALNLDD